MKLRTDHRHARHRMPERLPIISLIDVVFLLLVFFMVTSTISRRESQLGSALQVDRQQGGAAADLQPQIVHVGFEGGRAVYRIGARQTHDQTGLVAILRDLPKEGGVFLRVSDRAPVRVTAAAWQACRDAGFTKVSYVPTD